MKGALLSLDALLALLIVGGLFGMYATLESQRTRTVEAHQTAKAIAMNLQRIFYLPERPAPDELCLEMNSSVPASFDFEVLLENSTDVLFHCSREEKPRYLAEVRLRSQVPVVLPGNRGEPVYCTQNCRGYYYDESTEPPRQGYRTPCLFTPCEGNASYYTPPDVILANLTVVVRG